MESEERGGEENERCWAVLFCPAAAVFSREADDAAIEECLIESGVMVMDIGTFRAITRFQGSTGGEGGRGHSLPENREHILTVVSATA